MLQFQIEKDGDQYHTWCAQLPGCHSHGKTPKTAMINLKDAVSLYIEDVMEESFQHSQFKAFA